MVFTQPRTLGAYYENVRWWDSGKENSTALVRRKPAASGPFLPSITSTATRWPSVKPVIPARSSAEACTKISLPPRSEAIKPNPFIALYHLTVPDSSTAAWSVGGYTGRSDRARLSGSCCAVLMSTLRTSVTCGPLGPGPARTSSVAPCSTLSWPLRPITLTAQQINKTDRNDARGIAQMMRVGLFKPVHVKTLVAQKQRMLLTSRKLLQCKLLDVESHLRGALRNFGLKVGAVSGGRYDARVRELVEGFPGLAAIVEPLLTVRRVMRQQLAVLHKMLLDTVRNDPVSRRLMTAPGVGAVVALTYRATVDQPQRFVHSRAVGVHVGLTPKRYQSGDTDYDGGVSKCGDALLRTMLYEAAQTMLIRAKKWSWLKAWGMRVAQRRGIRRAIVAVARRLAVVLHRMWVDGTEFRWSKDSATVLNAA